MIRKLYTLSHDLEALKSIDARGQLTAEQGAFLARHEAGQRFDSRESLIRWYLSENSNKLPAVGFLIDYLNRNRFRRVVSFGAGACVLEYLLTLGLPPDAKVIAADFNEFFISKAQVLFPEILPIEFDFFRDSPQKVASHLGEEPDVAVFFGSLYVMDNPTMERFLASLRAELGVKVVIDFQSGFLSRMDCLRSLGAPLKRSRHFRKWLGLRNEDDFVGKFHGYARSQGTLESCYRRAGFQSIERVSLAGYKYVAVLQ